VGCAIIGKVLYKENIDVEYCNYEDINQKVTDYICNQEYLNFDFTYITDISVHNHVAQLIENEELSTFNLRDKVQLLDHHPTALELNKYEWCKVVIEEYDEKTSGTSLFYKYLLNHYKGWIFADLYVFTEVVRKYDTWLWKTKYNDNKPKMWNDLFYIMGRDNFINEMTNRIIINNFKFTDTDLKLLEYKQLEIDRYIESKSKNIIEKDILNYKAGIVFAESYHSELGNKLAENNPHLDFIVLINPSTAISYRGVKDNIDLGKDIASIYNGGGHPKAAGSPLPEGLREQIIELIFK